jgi:hypothetical protein
VGIGVGVGQYTGSVNETIADVASKTSSGNIVIGSALTTHKGANTVVKTVSISAG